MATISRNLLSYRNDFLQNNPHRLAHVSVGTKARQVRDGGLFVLLIIVFLNSKEVTANRKKRAKLAGGLYVGARIN